MKPHMKICILLPVYNDWICLPRLIGEIDCSLAAVNASAVIIIINDGGDPPQNKADFIDQDYVSISEFRIIELIRNVGNQNALAIGLSFIRDNIESDAVIVMDSDGQDSPSDIKQLLATHREHPNDLIAAERNGRSEDLLFRACYRAYLWFFLALTGKRLAFGNFSLIPSHHVARLCIMAELPINFAAALIKSRVPIRGAPCYRGARYDGVTSQNFVNLVIHGINGVSVFSETALVRISLFSTAFIFFALAGIGVVAVIRFFTALAVVGWATNVVGFLLILMCQALLLSLLAIIVRAQRPMALMSEPLSYKTAIASVTLIQCPQRVREMA
jgi:hypothetical protein